MDKVSRHGLGTGGVAYGVNIAPDVVERVRRERKNARCVPESGQCGRQIVGRGGADVAKILGDNQIWLQGLQQIGINGVDAFSPAYQFPYLPIDFSLWRMRIDTRLDQRGFPCGFGRKITLVGDTDHGIAEAKGIENFSSGWKQRDDSHGGYNGRRSSAQHSHFLFIKQVFGAHDLEFRKIRRPTRNDLNRWDEVDQRIDGRSRAQQRSQLGDVETIGIEAGQGAGSFQGKGGYAETHGGNIPGFHIFLQLIGPDPRRAEQLEGCLRTTSHGDPTGLKGFNAGINKILAYGSQIGGRSNPLHAGLVVRLAAAPIFHGDDVQLSVNTILGVEHARQFADGHGVDDGHGKIAGERNASLVKYGPFDSLTAQRIRPVEDEEWEFVFGGGFQAIAHGGSIGVEADAVQLNIENNRVDSFEHVVGRRAGVAVEAEDRQTGNAVGGAFHFGVSFSSDAVFRTEDRDQFYAVGMGQDINRAPALRVDAGLIGDQADVFALQRREIHPFEDVDARLGGGG